MSNQSASGQGAVTDVSTGSPDDRVTVGPRRVAAATIALATGAFAIGTSEFVVMGLLPEIARDVDVTIPQAGYLVSAYALGVVVGAPVLAAASARAPRKGLLLGLAAVIVLGNLLTVLAPSYATLVAARFLAGLPHGAFFGVASLVAASLVPPERRARAISRVMVGIPMAVLAGVPASTALGQQAGWRWAYIVVVGLVTLTVVAVAVTVPRAPGDATASSRNELRALRDGQVWFSMLVGAVGFGGMFAMYAYIAPTVTDLAGASPSTVPLVLFLLGIGATLGTAISGPLVDGSVERSVIGGCIVMVVGLAAFGAFADNLLLLIVLGFVVQVAGSVLVIGLQLRLMAAAGSARNLGAALNHASINVANALGAWIGGVVLTLGLGLRAPALAGAALAVMGLVLATVAARSPRIGRAPR